MFMWYIVLEDESGNKLELRDIPKDIEEVVSEYIQDMENN
jgi:hypothetical protein